MWNCSQLSHIWVKVLNLFLYGTTLLAFEFLESKKSDTFYYKNRCLLIFLRRLTRIGHIRCTYNALSVRSTTTELNVEPLNSKAPTYVERGSDRDRDESTAFGLSNNAGGRISHYKGPRVHVDRRGRRLFVWYHLFIGFRVLPSHIIFFPLFARARAYVVI